MTAHPARRIAAGEDMTLAELVELAEQRRIELQARLEALAEALAVTA